MKTLRILLIVSVLAVVSAIASPVGAISTYSSCFQVQNLDSSPATISIVYYNQDGSIALTVPDTIQALSKNPYCPIGASSGFNGSVVISSDKKVAAITNIEGDNQKYWGSYTAPSAGAPRLALPLIMKSNYGFTTWFNVQNTGSTNTDVLITYSNGTTESFAGLKPGAAHTFNQVNNGSLPSPFVGSAVASATSAGGQIAAVVLEVGPNTLHAYEGFPKGSKLPIMPLINENNYGYWSSAAIQNTGNTVTTVRVNYTPSKAGTACYEQRNIAAGQSKSFAMYAFVYNESPADPSYQSNCAKGATFIGSAVVASNSANVDLNVIVNQNNLTSSQNKASAYDAFDPADATSKVVFPLVMDRNYGYWTSLTVVNAGTLQTTVNCTFLNSTRTVGKTLNPGQALEDVHLNQISSGYVGAATCTATGGDAKIVGTLNELNTTPGYNWDTFMTFEGINQ